MVYLVGARVLVVEHRLEDRGTECPRVDDVCGSPLRLSSPGAGLARFGRAYGSSTGSQQRSGGGSLWGVPSGWRHGEPRALGQPYVCTIRLTWFVLVPRRLAVPIPD